MTLAFAKVSGWVKENKAKLKTVFTTVATHPSVLFISGNSMAKLATRDWAGLALHVAAVSIIGHMVARAAWKNEDFSMPYYMLGMINLLSAGTGFATLAAHDRPAQESPDHNVLRAGIMLNTAFALAGTGHMIAGAGAKKGKAPADLKSSMIFSGLGSFFGTLSNPADIFKWSWKIIPMALSAVGVIRTWTAGKNPKEGSASWQLTGQRFSGAGAVSNAVIAAPQNPVLSVAYSFWALGQWSFHKKQNKAVRGWLTKKCKAFFPKKETGIPPAPQKENAPAPP